jgi:large subunit ribosomal protein L9
MHVVLRQDVDHVGLRGEVVNVARGYARNYLLPRGLAEVATPALQKEVAKRDAMRARQEAKTVDEGAAIAARLEATVFRFDVTAGPTGTLFGSVTATMVADRLWAEQKIRVDRRKLHMETIKHVGRYTVPVDVFADVTADLRLVVAPEGVELPTEEELAAIAAAEEAAAAAVESAAVAAPTVEAPSVDSVEAPSDAEPSDTESAEAETGTETQPEAEPETEPGPVAAEAEALSSEEPVAPQDTGDQPDERPRPVDQARPQA